MTRLHRFVLLSALMLTAAMPVRAEEYKPDDRVMFDVAAEDWVTTKTARVEVGVEAAVTGNTAGTMRAAMEKAVNDLTKADWRLTSFNRSQDSTGLERWSAQFEARVPEAQLSGLNETAKKLSKAGMQLTVNGIDFTPTLEETQTVYGQLRTKIYKDANEQLAALNAALPGHNYRIALINFTGSNDGNPVQPPMPMVMRGYAKAGVMATAAMAPDSEGVSLPQSMERSEKVTLTARVVFAVVPPALAVVK